MFKKGVAVTYFPIGRFVSTTDGSEVAAGTPTGTYTKDGTEGTLSGTIAYKSTAKEWGITGLTATEMNGDVIGLNFTLAGATPIHYTIRTATKLVSELVDAPAVATDGSLQVTLKAGTHAGATIPTVTTTGTATVVTTVNGLGAGVITAASIAADAITAAKIADGAIDAATFATGAIDATVFAQAAADKVWSTASRVLTAGTNIVLAKGTGITGFNDITATSVWGVTRSGNQTAGTFGEYIDASINSRMATFTYTTPPTAAAIADAVWDELQSGHTTTGSFGANLDAQVSAVATGGISATDIATAVWAKAAVGSTTYGQISVALAAINCGDLLEASDGTTSSFRDINDHGPDSPARVTSTNTATTRTVTVH